MTTHLELVEQDNLRMYAAIKRVRELHKPYWNEQKFCDWCDLPYPCPTIQVLDGEQQ